MNNLLDHIRHWCKIKPGDPFAIDGETRLSYEDTLGRALRLAAGVKKLGVDRGDRVACIMFNRYRYLDMFYGVSAGGFVIVPLNIRLAGPELAYQINDSGAEVVILDPEFEQTIAKISDSLKSVKHFVYTGARCEIEGAVSYDSLLEQGSYETDVPEDALFGIFYTGGTTGLAKGVMLSHRNIISNSLNYVARMGRLGCHTALHSAPLFHIAPCAIHFFTAMAGASQVLVKAFEPVSVFNAISDCKVTVAFWPPTMINALVHHPKVKEYDLSSLELVLYGASPISPTLLRKASEVFGCEFVQAYGMTEASPIVTILDPEEHRRGMSEPGAERLLKSAGRQILGVEARVVDKHGSDVKPGETGEVVARGHNIMQGYWNKPAETSEVLIDGWYWTRDLAQVDEENYIYIVDRAKDMIISGGENIYSIEVEDALSRHPAVMEAAVIGIPDEKWGEAVRAIVVLKPGNTVTETELRDFCRQFIAGYKVPRSVSFLDALPKSAAGKVLKRELREEFWAESEKQVG